MSKRAFAALDAHVWRLAYKWARHSHPDKSKRWVIARYFGEFDRSRHDKWVFGDRSSGLYLRRFAWTPIVRHRMVPGTASVDDPALADFWALRRRRGNPLLDPVTLRLLRAQDGRFHGAGVSCCTPTTNRKTPTSGNSGSRWSATRSATRGHRQHRPRHTGRPRRPTPGTRPLPPTPTR